MLYSTVYGKYVLLATVSKTTCMKVVEVYIYGLKKHPALLFSSLINVILNVVPYHVDSDLECPLNMQIKEAVHDRLQSKDKHSSAVSTVLFYTVEILDSMICNCIISVIITCNFYFIFTCSEENVFLCNYNPI